MIVPLEEKLGADVCWFSGPIDYVFIQSLAVAVENLNKQKKYDTLAMFITTEGGSAEAAERAVHIMRHHYDNVCFLIPHMAMSAGTILALSGDKIYMQYTSSLGPIDPQIQTKDGKGNWVSALGYLDKVNELIAKSNDGKLAPAELEMLLNVDMGFLSQCEQASYLAQDLVKGWLVKYKFKDWIKHSSDGRPVTDSDKRARADDIVKLLGNNKHWHSHGRLITMQTLQNELRIHIDDFTNEAGLKSMIDSYASLLLDCQMRHNISHFFHNKKYF